MQPYATLRQVRWCAPLAWGIASDAAHHSRAACHCLCSLLVLGTKRMPLPPLRNQFMHAPLVNHAPWQVPGDGRELIATDPSAVKIRAEDGRWAMPACIRPLQCSHSLQMFRAQCICICSASLG